MAGFSVMQLLCKHGCVSTLAYFSFWNEMLKKYTRVSEHCFSLPDVNKAVWLSSLALALFLISSIASAANYFSRNDGTWTGNNRWSTASCGGASAGNAEPGNGDTATICNGDIITLDTSIAGAGLTTLTINAGGALQLSNGNTNRTLNVAGNISNAGTLSLPTNRNATITLSVGGNITNTGTFDFRTDADSLVNTTFTGGGTHTIDGNGAMRFNNVTVNNNLTINKTAGAITQTGTFSVTADLVITAGTLNLANTSTVTGTTSITGTLDHTTATGTRTFTGAVTINNGGTWDSTANEDVTMGNSLTNNGTFNSGTGAYTFQTTAGAVWAGTGGLAFDGAVNVNASRINNTTMSVSGTMAIAAGVTVTNNSTVTASGNITGANATTSIWTNAASSTLNAAGALLATGVLNASAANNTVTYNGAAQTVKLPSGTPATYFNLNLAGSAAKTLPATAMTVSNDLIMSGTATATAAQALTVGRDLTIGANNTFSGATFTHNIARNFTNNGTFTAGTSTINLNGAAQVIGGTASTTFFNLNLAGSGVKTLPTTAMTVSNDLIMSGTATATAGAAVTVGRDFTIGSNNTFSAATFTHDIARNFTNSGVFTAGTSTINLNGAAQVIGGTAATTFYNLNLAGSGAKTLPATVMTVSNDLIMSGTATATAAAAVTVGRDFTIGTVNNTFSAASFTHNVARNFTNNGTFTAGTSTFNFNGSVAQSISGTAATTFHNLTLNNSNGLSLAGATTTTVSNTVTLTSGRITTNANVLYVSSGNAIASAGANTFVVGNLRKRYTALGNQTRTFEVGTISGGVRYAPVALTLGNVTVVGDFTVSSTAGDHPDIGTSTLDAGLSINRYWTLTNTSVTFTANANTSIQYTFVNPGDYDVGADSSAFIVSRYNAPNWTEITPTATSVTTTTIGGTGITTANINGDYQLAEQKGAVTVFTAASGGSAISADTNSLSGSGVFTSLTGLEIRETNNGGMRTGNYTLTAPAGFQFDTATNVNITIGTVSGAGTDLGLSSSSVTPTSSTITFVVATVSSGSRLNSLTFSNLRIRPTASCPMATTGNIVFATATTTTIASNNAGTMTEVAGTAAGMYTVLSGQTAYSNSSCGTVSGTPADQFEDLSFNISKLVVTDQFGNIQTDYDIGGVTITYVYSGAGTPVFTSPVNFLDGQSTTTLTTMLDTPATGVTITASATGLTGITSTAFNVLVTPALPTAVLIYNMEQSSWTGVAGEVLDTSGNNLHGNALNGPDTSNAIPAIPGNPGTCNYGVFDQVDDLVQRADNALLDITNTLTVTSWIYTFGWPASDLKSIVSKDANYEYHLNTTGRVYWWWGGGARSLTSTSIIPLNQWHHIAIVYNNGNATIYIDGVADATTNDGFGTLNTNNNPLEIAADQSFAGRNFDGWIDEVRIYNAALTAPQIAVLKNQTYPCTNPPTFPTVIADWHLDGPAWIGTGDTVLDSGSNGFNGITNNTPNVIGHVCNAADLTANGTSDYMSMNVNALDNRNDFSISTWVKTTNTGNQALLSGARAGEDDELLMWFPSNTSFRPVVLGSALGGTAITIPSLTAVNPDISGLDNTWHHVVWTRNAATHCVFVDGDFINCISGQPTGVLDITGLIVGQEQDSVGGGFSATQDWEGYVDELVIFNGILTVADVQTIYLNQLAGLNYNGTERHCPVVQYNITHDGTGMSCLSETVTITAIDAHGDTTDPGNVTINLSVDPIAGSPAINPPPTSKGTWARLISAGVLSNNNNTSGSADVQFPGDGSSSIQLAFNYTAIEAGNTLETINFDIDDTTNNVTDTRNSSAITDPDMNFSLTGFQFYNYDTGDEIIPTQIAGKPSSTAPNDALIALRAMRVSDENPSVCEAAFPAGSNVTIPIGAECRNPASCSARQVRINSTPVDTNNDNSSAGTTSYTDVALSFEDDGTASGITRAPLVINYPDVGRIQLHARFEVPLDDGGSPPSGAGSGGYMEGSSQQFIVRPFGLAITDIMAGATANPGSLTVAGTKFTSAGSDFSVNVGAYLWEANDDDGNPWGTANDGIPDFRITGSFYEGVNITDNNALVGSALAPNFAWNGSLSAFANYAPTGGVLGALGNGAVVAGDFNGAGEATINDLTYSEVGTFIMLATFNDYLGDPTIDILGASAWNGQLDSSSNPTGAIGRFVPYDFDISVNSPAFGTECNAFTYVGQPFEFTVDPVLTVTARAEGGSTTQNYTGSFNRLTTASISYPGGTTEGFREGSLTMIGLDTGLIGGWLPTIVDQGGGLTDLTFSFGVGEQIAFNRITPVAPFDAEISLELNVEDLDGVYYGDGAGADINPAKFGDTGAGQGIAFNVDKEQRWGRLTLSNGFGSELLPVTVDLQAEYYLDTASGFVPNTSDACTVYQAANIGIQDANIADTLDVADVAVLVPAAPVTLVSGVSDPVNPVILGNPADSTIGPGAGKTGTLQLTLDLSALTGSVQDWLQFDWDNLDNLNDGPYDVNPSARATFGIYRGSKDFIYIREPWN